MKTYIILIMLLCLTASAEFKVDKNKFGVTKNIMFTGYVMDADHAKSIINDRIGKKAWVGSGNLLRCGDLFMRIGKNTIIVTVSHEMAMSHNKYVTKLRTIRKTRTAKPLRKSSGSTRSTRRRSA